MTSLIQHFHIPFDFDFHCARYRCHIASGDTAAFWFGALLTAGMLWNLWVDFRPGGQVTQSWPKRTYRWRVIRDVGVEGILLIIGLYMMACGSLGVTPFAWLG